METDQWKVISIVCPSVRQVSKLLTMGPGKEAVRRSPHAASSGHSAMLIHLVAPQETAAGRAASRPHPSVLGRFLRDQGIVERGQHTLSTL